MRAAGARQRTRDWELPIGAQVIPGGVHFSAWVRQIVEYGELLNELTRG